MNLLVIAAPNHSFYETKTFNGPRLGTSVISTFLEEMGHKVYLYEANYMYNKVRDDILLTPQEFIDTTEIDNVIDLINDDSKISDRMHRWMDEVAAQIDTSVKYDAIVMSILFDDIRHSELILGPFLFSHIIPRKLGLNVPVFIGGNYAMTHLKTEYKLDEKYKEIKPEYRQYYINDQKEFNRFEDFLIQFQAGNVGDPGFIELLDYKPKLFRNNMALKNDYEHPLNVTADEIYHPKILEKYPELYKGDDINIITYRFSTGCVFKCKFCTDGQRDWAYAPAKEIVDDLERYYDQGISDFRFLNTNINFNRKHVIEFCNEIVKRNMKIRFSDSANLNIVSKEMFDALGEAGCVSLWFGVETISEELLKDMGKHNKKKKVIEALKWSNDAGIMNGANIMHSLPYETDEQFEELLEFFTHYIHVDPIINSYLINGFRMTKGSDYYDKAIENNIQILPPEQVKFGDSNTYGIPFNELGRSWEERKIMLKHKYETIEDHGHKYDMFTLSKSDAIVFSARKAGWNKHQIVQLLKDAKSILNDDKEYMDFIRKHKFLSIARFQHKEDYLHLLENRIEKNHFKWV